MGFERILIGVLLAILVVLVVYFGVIETCFKERSVARCRKIKKKNRLMTFFFITR